MTEFQVHDLVYYGSLGHGVKFEILDRTEGGRWVLKCVESHYQYEGGWPIGRLMLADTIMLQEVYDSGRQIRLVYRNHRGRVGCRRIIPLSLDFGSSEHHPEEQWLLRCYDLDKGGERTYALRDCDFRRSDPDVGRLRDLSQEGGVLKISVGERATLLDGLGRLGYGFAQDLSARLEATKCRACRGTGFALYVGGDDYASCVTCGGSGWRTDDR